MVYKVHLTYSEWLSAVFWLFFVQIDLFWCSFEDSTETLYFFTKLILSETRWSVFSTRPTNCFVQNKISRSRLKAAHNSARDTSDAEQTDFLQSAAYVRLDTNIIKRNYLDNKIKNSTNSNLRQKIAQSSQTSTTQKIN